MSDSRDGLCSQSSSSSGCSQTQLSHAAPAYVTQSWQSEKVLCHQPLTAGLRLPPAHERELCYPIHVLVWEDGFLSGLPRSTNSPQLTASLFREFPPSATGTQIKKIPGSNIPPLLPGECDFRKEPNAATWIKASFLYILGSQHPALYSHPTPS